MTKQTQKTEDKVDFSIAEKWNGIAAIGAYAATGNIIPGIF